MITVSEWCQFYLELRSSSYKRALLKKLETEAFIQRLAFPIFQELPHTIY